MDWTQQGLRSAGFQGWIPFRDLRKADLPERPGVYVVLAHTSGVPEFLDATTAGTHKGRDLTVERSRLRAAWIDSSPVLYIGKATSLAERVNAYRSQGLGKKAGHQGGAYLWQYPGAQDAMVAWKATLEFSCVEAALTAEFMTHFGKLPFANRKLEQPQGCEPGALERFLAS